MKLSTMILAAGLAALPVLLLVQFRWTDAPDAEFGRRRARLLWTAALLFPLLALAHKIAVDRETPPPEPTMITTWPNGPEFTGEPPPAPPPPPPPPVRRQEDCPPGTTLSAGLCRSEPPIEE